MDKKVLSSAALRFINLNLSAISTVFVDKRKLVHRNFSLTKCWQSWHPLIKIFKMFYLTYLHGAELQQVLCLPVAFVSLLFIRLHKYSLLTVKEVQWCEK